jgi:hypothetical protein
MKISVHEAEKLSLEAIRGFVEASERLRFESQSREQVYGWVELVLRQQEYLRHGNAVRGLLRRYVEKITGLSRAQVTRLIASYMATGEVRVAAYRRHRFAQRCIQRFYAEHLNPYLNFHRPRAQADPEIDCQRTHPSKLQALPDHV